MASEEEIAKGLERLFRETKPSSFNSLNQVIVRLQSILGFDLSDKIDFIRDHITLLLTPPPPKPPSPPPSSFISPPFSTPLNPNPNPNPNPTPVISRPIPSQLNPIPVISRPVPSLVNSNAVISRPVPSPVNPNPNPSSVISRSFRSSVNPNPNPNPCSALSVVQHTNVSYYPNNVPHHPHSRQHVFQSSSHFPRGPTEISFAQPSASAGIVVGDSIASPPANAKDSGQKPKRRGGPGGLNKLCGVTPQLQTIVGQPAMPRTEIVKQLWAYIRKNNLQDPSNKRKIICNDELRLVFEVDCTDMFQMNKLLAKHILPLDSKKESGQPSKKLKVDESQAPSPEPAPIVISDALAKFFGTSEKEMLQPDVYKRVEEYIKTEGLEDPLNSTVVCDPKLQELLGCESITASAIRDALSRDHLFQRA